MSAEATNVQPATSARRPSRSLLLIVGVGGVVLSLLVCWALVVHQRQLVEVQFKLDAEQRLHAVRDAMTDRVSVVRTLVAFYAGSQEVERHEFHTFAEPLLVGYPCITLLGWVPRITAPGRDAHEQAVHDEGHDAYRIVQRDIEGRLVAAAEREQYLPACFLEPQNRVEQESSPHGISLGLDLGSSPSYAEILQRASQTNRPVATSVGHSVQPGAEPPGWLIVAPVVRPQQSSPSEAATDGFVFSLFQIGPIVEKALAEFPCDGIDIYLFDKSSPPDDCAIYVHTSPNANRATAMPSKADMPSWQTGDFEIADQGWLLASVPTDRYPAQQGAWQPLGALIVGLLVTALAVWYVVRASHRAERVEKIVTQRTAQLRKSDRLLRELIDLQERERKLIAYDIHDGLAQQLTGALMRLQAFGPPEAGDLDRIQSTCNELKEALGACLGEARRLISGLRPPILDELGIVAAVDYLIDEHRQQGGPDIELVADVRTDRFPPPLESAIFRIIQESLTNAVRYSQSEKVRVELRETDLLLHIEIQDWGIGFDPTGATANRFGLQGIRERVKLFSGTVVIDSAPGKGTRITVDLPRLMRAPAEP